MAAKLILASIAAGPMGSAAQAQTDVPYFTHGDRLTGEIMSLDRGKMSFEADGMSLGWRF